MENAALIKLDEISDRLGDLYQRVGRLLDEIVEITASSGQKYDLNDWYLDVATAGDGVVVIYS